MFTFYGWQNSIVSETPNSRRTSDHSGRKVKGRGQRRYRSPDPRSGSVERSTTPPHWRQAGANARRMDEEDWRQWRERQMSQQRNALEEKVSTPHSQRASSKGSRRRDPSLSPSAAATSARNRSPSASPSTHMDVDVQNFLSEKHISPSVTREYAKKNMVNHSPSRSSRRSDVLQTENIPSAKNYVPSSPREQSHYREKEFNGTHTRHPNSPGPNRVDRLTDDVQRDYVARERDSSVGSSIDTIRLMAKRRLIGDYDDDHYNIDVDSRAKTTSLNAHDRTSKRSVVPELPDSKSNGSSMKALNGSPKVTISPPSQRSPRKYAASPTLRSPSKVSHSPPARSDNLSEKYRSKSPVLETPVVQTEQVHSRRSSLPSPPCRRLSISPSRSNAELRMPSPPLVNALSVDIPQKPQIAPSDKVMKSLTERRTVVSQERSHSIDHNSSKHEHLSESQALRRSPTFNNKSHIRKSSSPVRSSPDISRIPLPKDSTNLISRSRSRSASRSDSHSSGKSSSHGSHHSGSHSHSSSRIAGRAPRSPPPHLVQKWRKREELRNQKRRIIPPAVASFGSPDEGSRSRDRRRVPANESLVHSRSVSRSGSHSSYSPPSRRKVRSSTSRSDSSKGPKHTTVTAHRSRSGHNSRSVSPPVQTRDRFRSTSGSPRRGQRSKNRGTSPGNPIIMVTRPDPQLQRITTTVTNNCETIPSASKWEKSPKDLDRNDHPSASKTWNTNRSQAVPEEQRSKLIRAPTTSNALGATSQSSRIETITSQQLHNLDSDSDSHMSEERVSLAHSAPKSLSQPSVRSDNSMALGTPARSASPASRRQSSVTDAKAKKLPAALRKHSTPSSSRSSSSSSSSCSSSASQSSKHSSRRPSSPRRLSSRLRSKSHSRTRRFQSRSDFSNSHSRGRGSQYTRSSAVSRTYYTRSPSRSFSTRASTNWGTRTSYTSRRRSWSRSRSRSYTRDSRSRSSSRRRYSSRRYNRRSRRSRRSSSSSRSRSSSRSYSGSSRRRLR